MTTDMDSATEPARGDAVQSHRDPAYLRTGEVTIPAERYAALLDAAEAAERRGYDAAMRAVARVLDGEPRGGTWSGEAGDVLEQVERLVRERDAARAECATSCDLVADAQRACAEASAAVAAADRERDTLRADLRRTEHDLARLVDAVGHRDRASTAVMWHDVVALCDEIDRNARPGWLAAALSPETTDAVRREREAWEARVSEAVTEGERRIDAVDRNLREVRAALGALGGETTPEAARRVARERDAAWAARNTARDERNEANARDRAMHRRAQRAEGRLARLERHDALRAAAIPAVRAGLDAGGSHTPDAIAARRAAHDTIDALADVLAGKEG